MVDHNLVGQVRSELDRLYNSNVVPQWRKEGVMNRVGALLNNGDYKNMTLYQLRQIAKQKGIANFSHTREEGIIYALEHGLSRVPDKFVQPSEKRNVQAERLGRRMIPSEGYGMYAQQQRGGQSSGMYGQGYDEDFDQDYDQSYGGMTGGRRTGNYRTGHFRTGNYRTGQSYSGKGSVGWNKYQSR